MSLCYNGTPSFTLTTFFSSSPAHIHLSFNMLPILNYFMHGFFLLHPHDQYCTALAQNLNLISLEHFFPSKVVLENAAGIIFI